MTRARSREDNARIPLVPMKKRRMSCFVPAVREVSPATVKLAKTLSPIRKIAQTTGSLKSYKEEACKQDQAIKHKYEIFYNFPETHPNYNNDWLNFWHNKCNELRSHGMDPTTFDFHDGWKKYFHLRLLDYEFLEKSQMRSELFKKHMETHDLKSKSPMKDVDKKAEDVKGLRIFGMSPTKKPIFDRLGFCARTSTKERSESKEPRHRSRSRYRPRSRSGSRYRPRSQSGSRYRPHSRSSSPHRRRSKARSRSLSSCRERNLSVKDRLKLMSTGKYKGRKHNSVSGKITSELVNCTSKFHLPRSRS